MALLRSILEEHGIQLNIQKGTLGNVKCTLGDFQGTLGDVQSTLGGHEDILNGVQSTLGGHEEILNGVQGTLGGYDTKLTEHDTMLADIHIQVDDRLEGLSVIADQLMNATTQASAGI